MTPRKPGTFAYESPSHAVQALVERLAPVAVETVSLQEAAGRILAEPLLTDRPSPPCDVSAMDGYAVRLEDICLERLAVAGEVTAGRAPPPMPAGAVLRVFTGAPIPPGCDAVIPREDVHELPDAVVLPDAYAVESGRHIRRCGENGQAGTIVVRPGTAVSSAVIGALAAFGASRPTVYRRVRVAILVTGNEVRGPDAEVRPWQIRDGNGPALAAMLSSLPYVALQSLRHLPDEPDVLRAAVEEASDASDALLLTGGVSMGNYDFVPGVLRTMGCEIVFHKLPIRPGKPVLGALGPRGQAVVGLPGNPVSALITARRIAVPLLRRLAGCAVPEVPRPVVALRESAGKPPDLFRYRLVRRIAAGEAEAVPSLGSGDLISAARSDGFVEIPPYAEDGGAWPFFSWSAADD